MSNDKALIIVESAQPPQIAARSDVSAAEIEYQRMDKEYKVAMDHLRMAIKQRSIAKVALTKAWLAENCPGIHCTVTPYFNEVTLGHGMEIFVDSPRFSMIMEEFNDYLRQITG